MVLIARTWHIRLLYLLLAFVALLQISCRTTINNTNNSDEAQASSRALYELRQRYGHANSDTVRWNVISELAQRVQSSEIDAEEARIQRNMWFPACDTWRTWTLPKPVNSAGDDYAPVPINDSTLLFTRARHPESFCATSDIFIAQKRNGIWEVRNAGRPFNDCHESSALSYNPLDSTVYLYGQYYLAMSHADNGLVLSPSYPSDVAQTQTVPYIFDHVTDVQNIAGNGPPRLTPLIVDYPRRTHQSYRIDHWASSVIDNRGDIYKATLRFDSASRSDGIDSAKNSSVKNSSVKNRNTWVELMGFPQRLDWPVSGGDFESDARVTPDGKALFLTSDRPNELYDYDAKEPHTTPERLHNWGNTNIYVVPLDRSMPMVTKVIKEHKDTTKGLNFILGAGINTAFAERTPAFSSNGDTMYFSSNGLPGYGGMDIYYATKQGAWDEWSEPVNMGAGLNTADDELWFVPVQKQRNGATHSVNDATQSESRQLYYFARRANDNLDIMMAERILQVQYVRIERTCSQTAEIVVRAYRADGSMTTTTLEGQTGFDLSDNVREIGIVVGTDGVERRFTRCNARADTLDLTTDDLSTTNCTDASIISSGGAKRSQWTFSVQEVPASISRSLVDILSQLQYLLSQKSTSAKHITIARAEGHDPKLFERFITQVEGSGGEVSTITTSSTKTTITIAQP